jgi:hypothetical protein
LMYKIIMRLATINYVTTTQTLCDNLQALGVFAATDSCNNNKLHSKFDKNYSQLITRGATADDPIGVLFGAYLVVWCHNSSPMFTADMKTTLMANLPSITHKALMTSAKCKLDWLKTKGTWGAKSPDNEEIVAVTAALNALNGHIKLDPKLSAIAYAGKKRSNKGKQKKKKKKTSYCVQQKKDEA